MQEWCTQLTLFTESRIEKCVILLLPSSYAQNKSTIYYYKYLQMQADKNVIVKARGLAVFSLTYEYK